MNTILYTPLIAVHALNMSPEEVRYRILAELEARPDLKQRDLARELGVSLGKINYCLRALIAKGYVKAGNFRRASEKSAYLYILTPKGLDEKLRQTRQFLARKQAEYQLLKTEIARLSQELERAEAEKGSA